MGSLRLEFHPGLVWGAQEEGQDVSLLRVGAAAARRAWEGGTWPPCVLLLPESHVASGRAGWLPAGERGGLQPQ